jgi:hypothetical protein
MSKEDWEKYMSEKYNVPVNIRNEIGFIYADPDSQLTEEQAAAIKADVDSMVNHPPHYTSDPSGIECIDITRHRNFNIGNAFKYLWRNGLKEDKLGNNKAKQIQDLEKAIFYIQDEIKRLQGEY